MAGPREGCGRSPCWNRGRRGGSCSTRASATSSSKLDAPVLQIVEEVDTEVLALLAFHEQAIVTFITDVPRPSSVGRATQPMDVEQVLDVPMLHMDHEDDMFPFLMNQCSNGTLSKL